MLIGSEMAADVETLTLEVSVCHQEFSQKILTFLMKMRQVIEGRLRQIRVTVPEKCFGSCKIFHQISY